MQDLRFTKYDLIDADSVDIYSKYESIIKFKRSLEKIEMLIGLSDTNEEKAELEQMKTNILEALNEEQTQLKEQQKKKKLYSLSTETVKEQDIGKLAKYYVEQQKKWKNSQVLEVDQEEQTAKIFKYGKKQQATFPAYKLKVLKTPDPGAFKQETFCKAIYSGDGEFYPCVIQKVDGDNYHVKYKKYNSKQVVQLHRLREMRNAEEKDPQDYKFDDLNELKIPQNLKILPNDPQNVKKSKKTKVKAMKFAFKNAQVDQVNKEKQSKWQSFNSGLNYGHSQTKLHKQLINKTKEHRIDPSRLELNQTKKQQ